MADEQNSIQVESSSDTLGEAPVKSTPGVEEKATAVKPVESTDSEEASDDDNGDEAGDEVGGEQQPGEPGKAKTPRGVQKKLDKLTAARRTAEQERDYWRAEALKAKEKPEAQAKSEVKSTEGKPTLEQFDYDQEKWVEAVADWRLESRLREQRAAEESKREELTQAEKTKAWMKKADEFAESHEDFREVALNNSLPVSKEMYEIMLDSERGHELLYYLGKHPEEAAKIYQMKPHAAGVALGKIEAGLEAYSSDDVQFTDAGEPHEQPERKVTKAPPPIKTLNPSAPVKRNLADMSMEDYVSERQRTRRKSNGFL